MYDKRQNEGPCKFLTCKLDQVDEQETPDELFNENDNDSLM